MILRLLEKIIKMNKQTTILETESQVIDVAKSVQDYSYLANNHLKIWDKSGKLVDFKFKSLQQKFHEKYIKPIINREVLKLVILKFRQGFGCTTWCCSLGFHNLYTRQGFEGRHVIQVADKARGLSKKYATFQKYLPDHMKLPRGNFSTYISSFPDRNSFVYFISAKTSGESDRVDAFKSESTHGLHFSEIALYTNPEELVSAAMPTFQNDPGNYIIFESTPLKLNDYFYNLFWGAERGENAYTPVFLPWFDNDEYRIFDDKIIEIEDDDEKHLVEVVGLDFSQIKWRRFTILDLATGIGMKRATKIFKREYPEDKFSCFLSDANTFFDSDKVQENIKTIEKLKIKPLEISKSEISDPKMYAALKEWDIFQKPLPGDEIVIGADCGEGNLDSDYDAAIAINKNTRMQVGTLYGQYGQDEYARLLHYGGLYFNKACLAVEKNNPGWAVVSLLKDKWQYPNQYKDPKKMKDKNITRDLSKIGWVTHAGTRYYMLDKFRLDFEADLIFIVDVRVLSQMLAFDINSDDDKQKDDLVLGGGIAHAIIMIKIRYRMRVG